MSNYVIHFDSSDYIAHIGNKNSGRYPRGSGENPHQHDGLLSRFRRKKNTPVEEQPHNQKQQKTDYKISTKKVSKMSDAELREHVQRLRLQKEAKELSHFLVDKHAFEKPKGDSVIVKAGKRIGETALTGAGLYLLKTAISGTFDRQGLGSAVFKGGYKK